MKSRRFVLAMVAPSALFALMFALYPIITLARNSLSTVEQFDPSARTFVGLRNYASAFQDQMIRTAAVNTLRYAVVTIIAEFIIGIAIAVLFDRWADRSRWARSIFVFPLLLPPIVAGLMWKFLLSPEVGLLSSISNRFRPVNAPIDWLGSEVAKFSVTFADIWLTTSFVTLLCFAGLRGIPGEILEAATIDRAGFWRTLWSVKLPMLRPVLAVALIIRGVDSAKTFDLVWVQTKGGPDFMTETLSMNVYRTMVSYGNIGGASATAMLFMAAMSVLAFLAYRFVWGRDQNA